MPVTVLDLAVLAAAGALAGVLGAMLGIGGGIFLVPVLVLGFKLPIHVAVAASLLGSRERLCGRGAHEHASGDDARAGPDAQAGEDGRREVFRERSRPGRWQGPGRDGGSWFRDGGHVAAGSAAGQHDEGDGLSLRSPAGSAGPYGSSWRGRHSSQRGDHRIIHRIDEDRRVVVIEAIGHRADIYRPR